MKRYLIAIAAAAAAAALTAIAAATTTQARQNGPHQIIAYNGQEYAFMKLTHGGGNQSPLNSLSVGALGA